MANPDQLPYLLRLIDDDSPTVRDTVTRELAKFGPELHQHVAHLDVMPSAMQLKCIRAIVNGEELDYRELESGPLYGVGQVVKHRRYGYLGLIVECDESCHANDEWYWSNKTQPDRYQPWYHVLVSDTDHVTYAAESSLTVAHEGRRVKHPLIPHFFSKYEYGYYERNERPWPDWDEDWGEEV